jgi:hypothetical protein
MSGLAGNPRPSGQGGGQFVNLSNAPVALEGPSVIEGTGVTHLIYRVQQPGREASR